jgi:acetyl esterase
MPLDPQIASIIEQIDRRPRPLWEVPLDEARRVADEGMLRMREIFGVEEVADVLERTVPGPAGPVRVRVYRPEGHGPHGVLVFFHGGGYVFCSLDTHDQLCRMLTNRGRCVVVSVDYRLAPEHPFPAGIEDAWAVTKWVQDNAAEIHGDRERVAVGGDSAGGNFAAVVALHNRDDRRRLPLRAQLLLYPTTDRCGGYKSLVENGEGYLLTTEMRKWFARCYVPEGTPLDDWRLSPICAPDHSDSAPAIVVTAEYDPLRDEGDAYVETLRAVGVPVDHVRVDGMIHGFLQYAPFHDGARAILDEVGAILKRRLA